MILAASTTLSQHPKALMALQGENTVSVALTARYEWLHDYCPSTELSERGGREGLDSELV
jgi:hypothetical protein